MIEGTLRGGNLRAKLYFDTKTNLLVRVLRFINSPIGRVPIQVDLADYRDVNGIKFPFKMAFLWLDGRYNAEIKDVKVNVPSTPKCLRSRNTRANRSVMGPRFGGAPSFLCGAERGILLPRRKLRRRKILLGPIGAEMQVLYALPFILLAAIIFFVCLVVRRLRPYALQALVAPIAFGACSLGLAVFTVLLAAAAGSLLHVRTDRLGAAGQAAAVVLGVLLYLCGGALGARWAVVLVRRGEAAFLKPPDARRSALRAVIGFIVFGLSSFTSMGIAEGLTLARTVFGSSPPSAWPP